MFPRTSYQSGSLRKVSRKRGPAVWKYRWYDTAPQGGKRPYRKLQVGTVEQYRTQAAARRALDAMRLDINRPTRSNPTQMMVADLIEHYAAKELGKDRHSKAETTVEVYRGFIEQWIQPRWGSYRLKEVRTAEVEEWLRSTLVGHGKQPKPLAGGTKAKIRNIFSALFSHAVRWEFASMNPITGPSRGSGVRQSGRRQRTPDVLTISEIRRILT